MVPAAELGNTAGLVGAADLARPFARRFRRARARAARPAAPGAATSARRDRLAVRMSNVDAAWLGMDSPDNLMMVTAVLRPRRGASTAPGSSKVLNHRLLSAYPKFSMRPLPSAARSSSRSGSTTRTSPWPGTSSRRGTPSTTTPAQGRSSPGCSADRWTCGTRRGSSTWWTYRRGTPTTSRAPPSSRGCTTASPTASPWRACCCPSPTTTPTCLRSSPSGWRAPTCVTRAARGCGSGSPRARPTSRRSRGSTRSRPAPAPGGGGGALRLAGRW